MSDDALMRTSGFGIEQVSEQKETSALAMAERAKAQITARYIMAERRPRDYDVARQKLLKECSRPKFAGTARFKKPQGKKKDEETGQWVTNYIEGPTIRFAEAAIQCMTNISVSSTVIADDAKKRVIHIEATDLESNVAYETEVTITKTVERSKPRQGQRIIGERQNSYGDRVFIVEATDDEVDTKAKAAISKEIRTLGLRHVPGYILEEAMESCIKTVSDQDAKDPDATRKALLDAFFKVGVPADQIALYLGHKPDVLDPAELEDLRGVYAAILEKEVTWRAVLEMKTGEVPAGAKDGKEAAAAQAQTQKILEKRRAEAEKKAAAKRAAAAKKDEKKPETVTTEGEEVKNPETEEENERAAGNPDDPDSYG